MANIDAAADASYIDLDWVERATILFANQGPFLVAILLLALSIPLVFFNSRFIKIMGVVSFVASLAAFWFAVNYWTGEKLRAEVADPNRSYVQTIAVDITGKKPLIKKVDLPQAWEKIRAQIYHQDDADELKLIIISPLPIPDGSVEFVLLRLEGEETPIVLCPSMLREAQHIQITQRNAPDKQIPQAIMQVMMKGTNEWKDLTCF